MKEKYRLEAQRLGKQDWRLRGFYENIPGLPHGISPTTAWCLPTLKVFRTDRKQKGRGDQHFLRRVFNKLLYFVHTQPQRFDYEQIPLVMLFQQYVRLVFPAAADQQLNNG